MKKQIIAFLLGAVFIFACVGCGAESITTEPTETAEPKQTETPTTEPVTQYTYTDMSATMYAQQAVNVRDLPDTSGNKLGSLSTNDEITISGQCNETSWYRFEYFYVHYCR